MSFPVAFIMLVVGLIIIVKGGDVFVDASIQLASLTGIPKILIGATLVSVATVLPEVLVSTMAVAQGASDMGVSTNLGSVICNTGLILGISITALPQQISGPSFVSKALLILAAILVLMRSLSDEVLSGGEGTVLFFMFLFYILSSIWEAKSAPAETGPEERGPVPLSCLVKFIFGAGAIVLGARLMVNSGVAIANLLGVSERIIGLTVLAIGTALPELVTTLTAVAKREFHLSVGNILGANFMNLVLIPALCAWVALPAGLSVHNMGSVFGGAPFNTTVFLDMPVVLIFSLLVIVPALWQKRLSRWQGVWLLILYALYLLVLALG